MLLLEKMRFLVVSLMGLLLASCSGGSGNSGQQQGVSNPPAQGTQPAVDPMMTAVPAPMIDPSLPVPPSVVPPMTVNASPPTPVPNQQQPAQQMQQQQAQQQGQQPPPAANNMSFFVTSVGNGANGGNYGGLAGADARCQ